MLTTTPGVPAAAFASDDVAVTLDSGCVMDVPVDFAEGPSGLAAAGRVDAVDAGSADEPASSSEADDAVFVGDALDESAESVCADEGLDESAHAAPHPIMIAAPIPRPTANPPTRPIYVAAFVAPLTGFRLISVDKHREAYARVNILKRGFADSQRC